MATSKTRFAAREALREQRKAIAYQLEEAKGFQYHAFNDLVEGKIDTYDFALAMRARLETHAAHQAAQGSVMRLIFEQNGS